MSDRRMETGKAEAKKPIRVLLLDDRQDNLILRAAILRSHGYEAVTSSSVEEAEAHLARLLRREHVAVQGGDNLVSKSVSRIGLHFADGQLRAQTTGAATSQVQRSAVTLPEDVRRQA